MGVDVDKFWQDGFLIIRNALPQEKVAKWRERGLRANKRQDLLSDDILAEVVCEPLIVDTARQILGGDPVYFGDSTVMRGTEGGVGFHKDNTDRLDWNAPDWKAERYPFIRFGIYTQPHGKLPHGLDLRVGSHHHADFTSGKIVSAEVEPGDLIAWNGRTTHSGNSKIFRVTRRRLKPDLSKLFVRAVNRLGGMPWLFIDHPQERVAIFTSYALEGPLLDRHIEYLKQREYAVERWKLSQWSNVTRQMADDAGLRLIDVTRFEHDGRELHRFYHPIPY